LAVDNDGHDTGLAGAAKFLGPFMDKLFSYPSFWNNTLVVITFDEDNYFHLNKIYTLLIGSPIVQAGGSDAFYYYTHFNLLATVEQNWNLGDLGRHDKDATAFKCLHPANKRNNVQF